MIHTYHYITLHYITLHYITLHYITLHNLHTYILTSMHPSMHPCMHTHTHIHIDIVIIFYSAQCSPGDLGVCLWEALPWPEQRGVAQQRQPEPLPRRAARRRRGARSLGQTWESPSYVWIYSDIYIYIRIY